VTIRVRVSLAVVATVLVLLVLMTGILYYEFAVEQRERHAAGQQGDPVEDEILEVVVLFGLPAVLVLGVGSWWLVRRALGPLDRLAEAAARIHAGSLAEPLPGAGADDEVGRLATVFNAMMARLDASFAQVKDFTLHASHELKTPLAILQSEIETALADPGATAAQREMFVSQLDEVHRLTKIVDGLTFLARADTGQLKLAEEPVRLDELVRDMFADAEILAHAAGLKVVLARCDTVTVRGDRHRLRQVLLNLVDNAVKFNRPDGEVTFALTRHTDTATLRIANAGPGIPPETLPRVFDRLYRGETASGRSVEGSGLGLSIARSIVVAHGGRIDIASTPGHETTVTVSVPTLAS
jgi:heavy metal sensor kinase